MGPRITRTITNLAQVEIRIVPAPHIWVRMEPVISKTVKVVEDSVDLVVDRTGEAKAIPVAAPEAPIADLVVPAVPIVDPVVTVVPTADPVVTVDQVGTVEDRAVDVQIVEIPEVRVVDSNRLNPGKSMQKKFRIKSGKPSPNWLDLLVEVRA